jgi:SAM-dependent methyltransferase
MTVAWDPEGAEGTALHAMVDLQGKTVLEIGCGDGRLTWRYAPLAARVTAIDPDSAAIAAAQEDCPDDLRAKVEFLALNLNDYAARAAGVKFDVALFSWSLCCLEDDEMVHALEICKDFLNPGGHVLNIQPVGKPRALEMHLDGAITLAGLTAHRLDFAGQKASLRAMEHVVKDGLFVLERERSIPFHYHAPSFRAMRDWISENMTNTILDDETARRARELQSSSQGAGDWILREELVFSLLRPAG